MASKATSSNTPNYYDCTDDTASIATTTTAAQHDDDRHETMSIATTVLPAYSQSTSEPMPPSYHPRRTPPYLHFQVLSKHAASLQYAESGEEFYVAIKKSERGISSQPSLFVHAGSNESGEVVVSSRILDEKPMREAFCYGDHSEKKGRDVASLDWNRMEQKYDWSLRFDTGRHGRRLVWRLVKAQLKSKGPWYLYDAEQVGPDGEEPPPPLCTFDRSGKGPLGTLKWHADVSREEELAAIIALVSLSLRLKNDGYMTGSIVESLSYGLSHSLFNVSF